MRPPRAAWCHSSNTWTIKSPPSPVSVLLPTLSWYLSLGLMPAPMLQLCPNIYLHLDIPARCRMCANARYRQADQANRRCGHHPATRGGEPEPQERPRRGHDIPAKPKGPAGHDRTTTEAVRGGKREDQRATAFAEDIRAFDLPDHPSATIGYPADSRHF